MSFPKHGIQIYGPGITEVDAAKKAAELGSNVIRTRINWDELEPQKGNWDSVGTPNQGQVMARYRNICLQARNHVGRPGIKLLPVFDNFPCWVNGVIEHVFPDPDDPDDPDKFKYRRHYSASEAGCEEFGVAVGHVMSDLGGYADLIEISNEPNIKVIGPDAASAGIPTDWYGRMSAHAMFWIDACTGGNPAKGILMGAIDCITGAANTQQNPHPNWVLDAPEVYASKISDAFNIWLYLLAGSVNLTQRARISCHPYPDLKQAVSGSQASAKVWQRFNKIWNTTIGRKLWITEVGASSHWLFPSNSSTGKARQADFITNLMYESAIRHGTQNLEGVVMWPLNDHADLDGPNNDSQFKDTGLYDKNLVIKPAGTTVTNQWAGWN